jgi:predicted acetyltransferase
MDIALANAQEGPALSVRRAAPAERPLLQRMLELYQHDLSDLWDQDLDEAGEFGYELDRYWADPSCHPYVFRVGGRPAGFALVDARARLPGGAFWMDQFFVLRKYRRLGVATRAATALFDHHRGAWQVGQMPGNRPAQAFWRRVIAEVTAGRYVEHTLVDGAWQGVVQCFDSRAGRAAMNAGHADGAAAHGVQIRSYEPAHFEPLVQALHELEQHYHGDDAPTREAVAASLMTGMLGPRSGVSVLVALDGNEVAGLATYALLYPAPQLGGQLFMKDLFVRQRWRGQGLGERLMRHLAEQALQLGCVRFDWTAEHTNAGALAFYDRLGARRVAEKVYFRLSGDALAALNGLPA